MAARIFFMHIPKTGGMAYRQTLAGEYQASEIFPVPFRPSMTLGEPEAYPVQYIEIGDIRVSRDVLAKYNLIMGHLDARWLAMLPDGFQPVTILRDPIDQFASLYYYMQQSPDASAQALWREVEPGGIEGWLEHPAMAWAANQQSRYLSGMSDVPGVGDLSLALENAKQFNILYQEDLRGKKVNVTNAKPKKLAPDLRQRIAEIQHVDMDLYHMLRNRG